MEIYKIRNKNYYGGVFFATALVLTILVTPSYALFGGKVESYSAENVEISGDGKVKGSSMLYMTPDAMRMDGLPGMGEPGAPKVNLSILVLKKENKQYMYNHDKKLVFESPVDEENYKSMMKELDNIQTEKILGEEKVSGYKCVKKEVVTSINIMGMVQKSTSVVWVSDRFDLPLRTKDEDGTVMEMRNIKKGKPAASVFKPLAGYKKVDNMMLLMGVDLGAMMGGAGGPDKQRPGNAPQDSNELMKELQKNMGELGPEAEEMMRGIMQQMGGKNQGRQ